LEDARIVLEFSEMKTGNVLELPEPLQMLFADENH
jgi:hypothetical protein